MSNICFLLGVMPRSGTNYISNVLTLNSRCRSSEPIYEDFLLSQSHLLLNYSRKVSTHWNSNWDTSGELLSEHRLIQHIGQGLTSFINETSASECTGCEDIIVAKTPSTKNLDNYFKLFPKAKLILIMRDGRAVVESGVKSFDWDFEKAAYDWHGSTSRIVDFLNENKEHSDNLLLVKYEDMLLNRRDSLKKIYNFLNLDINSINEKEVESLFVSGSSEIRRKTGSLSWSHVENNSSFRPLERYSGWRDSKLRRFEWLAGDSLLRMGYIDKKLEFSLIEKMKHYFLDVSWFLRVLPKTIFFLVRDKKLILKTY